MAWWFDLRVVDENVQVAVFGLNFLDEGAKNSVSSPSRHHERCVAVTYSTLSFLVTSPTRGMISPSMSLP